MRELWQINDRSYMEQEITYSLKKHNTRIKEENMEIRNTPVRVGCDWRHCQSAERCLFKKK
jgi:hypothetical protein